MLSLIIGAFFAILNETLLNIALTTLMDQFDITLPTVQWMATGFMLVMGIVIPVSALLIQWFTTRQLFLILLTGRLIQAVGTGMLMPIMFNVFLLMYPPHKRGRIMGIVGLVIMFAPAIGPTLSGIIVEYLGWCSRASVLSGPYMGSVPDVPPCRHHVRDHHHGHVRIGDYTADLYAGALGTERRHCRHSSASRQSAERCALPFHGPAVR